MNIMLLDGKEATNILDMESRFSVATSLESRDVKYETFVQLIWLAYIETRFKINIGYDISLRTVNSSGFNSYGWKQLSTKYLFSTSYIWC